MIATFATTAVVVCWAIALSAIVAAIGDRRANR